MRKGTLIVWILLLAVLAAACSKQSLKATYDRQTTFIEDFVTAKLKEDPYATLVRNGHSYRLTLHDTLDRVLGQRDSLLEGGRVTVYYACYTLTGSSLSANNLVATNVQKVAQEAKWDLTDTSRFKLDTLTLDRSLVNGLHDGLLGVQPFDECVILFTGEYGFGNVERGTIPARSALAYQFWIESIENE